MRSLENTQDKNISLIDNIILAFKATEMHIKGLTNDITDLLQYKMFVLSLDNAVELLFKFMIVMREEILLYADENTEKVLKKYKKAHKAGWVKLETFFQINPMENDLHTISFSRACDILTEYYQVIGEVLALKCKKLAQVRNGFTHYSTTIRYIDVVTFLHIYKKCVQLFKEEIDNKTLFNWEVLLINQDRRNVSYDMDMNTYSNICKICQEAINRDILNNAMFLHIVGFIIDEYQGKLIEVCPEDYDTIEKLFFDEKAKLYGGNNLKRKHEEFKEVYKIMVDAEIVYEDYEIYEDKLSTLMVTEWVLKEIENKWDKGEQRKKLQCNKSITEVIESLKYMDEKDWWN